MAASHHPAQENQQLGVPMADNVWADVVILSTPSSILFVAGRWLRRFAATAIKVLGSWGQFGAFCLALALVLCASATISVLIADALGRNEILNLATPSSILFAAGKLLRRSPKKPTNLFGTWGQLGAFFLAVALVLSTCVTIILFLDVIGAEPEYSEDWDHKGSSFVALVMLCTPVISVCKIKAFPTRVFRWCGECRFTGLDGTKWKRSSTSKGTLQFADTV
ncbi:MAG: hypothetical protein Q9221_008192 [Calogaya cf. arnoldii]